MNLFYDPSIAHLRQLVDTADKSLLANNIVIDYDGEVIIDPEKKFAGVELSRFKFRTQVTQAVTEDMQSLLNLFETLRAAYNGDRQQMHINRRLRNAA